MLVRMTRLDGIDVSLLEHLAVPASLHDVDGTFVYVNPAAERASGRSNAEWLGRRFTETLPPEARRRVAEHFKRAVEHAEPATFETDFFDAFGNRRTTHAQHLPIRDGEKVVGVVILAFDADPASRPPDLPASPRLTQRQREVLALMATGRTTADIAAALTLSIETVRNHIRAVMRELNAHTRSEALVVARQLGLLATPPLGPPSGGA